MNKWRFDDRDFSNRWFPPSQPLKAKGGIKAQSQRGAFGSSWWAKRWIGWLEAQQIGGRLQRGRKYARAGQVLGIDVQKSRVTAEVQGSSPIPYEVSIAVKPLAPAAWRKVAAELAGRAIFAAKLLAGEMPQDIESVFSSVSISLFPDKLSDLNTSCSCPDYSNPCKHIAAVYYLLGEEFDRDPFLIFRIRGLDRTELMGLLANSAGRKPRPAGQETEVADTAVEVPREELPSDPAVFWQVRPLPTDVVPLADTGNRAALLRRLGGFPFWRGQEPFLESLERVYEAASEAAAAKLKNCE